MLENDRIFEARVALLTKRATDRWNKTFGEPNEVSIGFSDQAKARNELLFHRTVDELTIALRQMPAKEKERVAWRKSAFQRIQAFTAECMGYPQREVDLLFDARFHQVTADFVFQCNAFNPHFHMSDLFQSLRNVWIMNSVQILLDQSVRLSESVFAYSMLYPYTDNYLDARNTLQHEKKQFNDRIERRIDGEPMDRTGAPWDELDLLFSLIEREHPRVISQDVFSSLQAIHQAQRASLGQHGKAITSDELLRISFRKGGTSVLAHGYLVNRTLTDAQADFLFGYGVFLQLMDDLQDINFDRRNNHRTLFSDASPFHRRMNIVPTVTRLITYAQSVLSQIDCFPSNNRDVVQAVVWRNCLLLVTAAVLKQRRRLSFSEYRQFEAMSPLPAVNLNRMRRKFRRFYVRATRQLTHLQEIVGPPSRDLWALRQTSASTR